MALKLKLPEFIAHRGASGQAPENTLTAFSLAAEQGASWVELDANISADNTVFVHHDDTVERCTNGSGYLVQLKEDELKKLDAGSWFNETYKGEPLPTLQAVMALLNKQGLGLNLEIKPTPGLEERTADAVCDAIEKYWPHEQPLLISSFSERSLLQAARRLPNVPRGYLLCAIPEDWQQRLQVLDCQTFHCAAECVEKTAVQKVTQAGYEMLCYTVNDPVRARQLLEWGVSSVFTDYPGCLKTSPANS